MRGKLQPHRQAQPQTRITPADAGKTRACCRYRTAKQDHPRGCGENFRLLCRRSQAMGSPPRMRGKRRQSALRCYSLRITPADAGKTAFALTYFQIGKDHPRGCGENQRQANAASRLSGSPPRMRGKHDAENIPQRFPGITPADAGKTVSH